MVAEGESPEVLIPFGDRLVHGLSRLDLRRDTGKRVYFVPLNTIDEFHLAKVVNTHDRRGGPC